MERAEPDQARDTCGPAAATPQRGQPRGPRGEGRDQRTHSAGSTQVGNRASDVLDWGEEPVVLIPPWDGGRIRPRRVRVKILRGRTGPRGGGGQRLSSGGACEAVDRVLFPPLVEPAEERRQQPLGQLGCPGQAYIEHARLPDGLKLEPVLQLSLEYLQREPLDLRYRRAAMDILAPGAASLGKAWITPPRI